MKKILLVEDDLLLSKMYKIKLGVAGYEVLTAPNGEDGIEKMKSWKPDLVIMDLMMPKLNGMQALEKAKADPSIKDIPVVLLTNLSGGLDEKTAISKGALSYIVKSDFTPAEIIEKIQALLKT